MALDSELLARIDERTRNILDTVRELKEDREKIHDRITETKNRILGQGGIEHRLSVVEERMNGAIRWMKILTGAITTAAGAVGSYMGLSK